MNETLATKEIWLLERILHVRMKRGVRCDKKLLLTKCHSQNVEIAEA
jgi:hypothetical protein